MSNEKYYKLTAKCHAPSDYMKCLLVCRWCQKNEWVIEEKEGIMPTEPDDGDPRLFHTKEDAEKKMIKLQKEYYDHLEMYGEN